MTMIDALPSIRSLTRRLLPTKAAMPSDVHDPIRERAAAVPPMRPRVEIPVCDVSPEEQALVALHERGQHLARQENWETLCREMIEAEHGRAKTPGLTPVAQVLAEGARADVLEAAKSAVSKGEPRRAFAAMASLEINLDDMPECFGFASVVAMAHVELAQMWRGRTPLRELSPQIREAHDRHMRAASQLADRFEPFAADAPLLAMLRCAVIAADVAPSERLADDFEDLIDLDPTCPEHMCAFGRQLLPQNLGSWEALELQARRVATNTSDIWGSGGYTWVWIGALEQDIEAVRRVDAETFTSGLHDILEQCRDQHMANRLAAFTGVTMAAGQNRDASHSRIAHCFGWIAQNHLREIHPGLWAKAPAPWYSANNEPEAEDAAARGKARALSTLASYFAPQLGQHGRITFGENGVEIV